MNTILSTRLLEKQLIQRGLLPARCRLVEVSITPNSPLVLRYEVFVEAEQLSAFADAMKAAADEAIESNERNRIARSQEVAAK